MTVSEHERETAGDGDRETYTVEFAKEGVELECPRDQYVLEAAEEAGVDLPYQCLQGVCAACSARVEGEVDRSEDRILTQWEQDQGYALLCISYPRSDLTVHSREEP